MKHFILSIMIAGCGLQARADDLSRANSPASIFASDAEARANFSEVLEADSSLTEVEREMYKNLVIPEDGRHIGDALSEQLDENTLNWYYGVESSGGEQLYRVALVGDSNINECLRHRLCVHVSKRQQRMTAYARGQVLTYKTRQGGNKTFRFENVKVSTARNGKVTPIGLFSVGEIADRNRLSGLYKDAALYYAMHLVGDIFIHATSENNYPMLGSPASAGCIRTDLASAAVLNHHMRQLNHRRLREEPYFINQGDIRVVVTEN